MTHPSIRSSALPATLFAGMLLAATPSHALDEVTVALAIPSTMHDDASSAAAQAWAPTRSPIWR